MPDQNDIPEEHEIELLWHSLEVIRKPSIDQQARMTLQWLSSDSLAKVVLDELDKLPSQPNLDKVSRMIAFLEKFPRPARQFRALDEQTSARRLRNTVAVVNREGVEECIKLKHRELCERLDARRVDLPSNAKWRRFNSWVAAWNDRASRSSVS